MKKKIHLIKIKQNLHLFSEENLKEIHDSIEESDMTSVMVEDAEVETFEFEEGEQIYIVSMGQHDDASILSENEYLVKDIVQ